ncbi:MAG: hypothetical protein K1X83_12465 [Oligoflexia bacterium]|nr:hypothetical protein [Oligoflexia bacterium]
MPATPVPVATSNLRSAQLEQTYFVSATMQQVAKQERYTQKISELLATEPYPSRAPVKVSYSDDSRFALAVIDSQQVRILTGLDNERPEEVAAFRTKGRLQSAIFVVLNDDLCIQMTVTDPKYAYRVFYTSVAASHRMYGEYKDQGGIPVPLIGS